jgi:hypothetical protein
MKISAAESAAALAETPEATPASTSSTSPPPAAHNPDTELPPGDKRARGVTPRVVVLSLVLAVFFGYVLPVVDYKLNNTFLGGAHLPPGAIGTLLVLVLVVNPLLRKVSQKWGLSRNETLSVYITCLFSSMVPGHGSENFTVPNLLAPFYFATRENGWLEIMAPYIKPWISPAIGPDGKLIPGVADGWYTGLTAGQAIPWAAWTLPLIFWVSFTLISYAMLGCLSIMLRAQWAEHEALAFPLLRLPLQMTEDLDRSDTYGVLGRFFRNPMMWIGFAIAVFIQGIAGLHLYFPDVPNFPLDLNLQSLLSDAPWNQIGWVPVKVYLIVIGITYLLTAEVSFSLWAFITFFHLQYITAYYLGFTPNALPGAGVLPDKVFTGYQQAGAYFAYVALVLWTGREHFRHVARRALGREKARPSESEEVLSYPLAFWGFVLCFALMVAACVVSGVRVDVAIGLWVMYLVFAIGLSRVAVEGGMLALQHHAMPLGILAKLGNTGPSQWLTYDAGVVPASLFQSGFAHHMRCFIMPSFLHGLKLAHDRRIAVRPLALLVVAVVVISTIVSWITVVRLGYENGGLQLGHTWWARDGAKSSVWFVDTVQAKANNEPASTNWIWLSFGGALTWAMMIARTRLVWFPLHPIGYLMALTYPSKMFAASIFIGWLAKVVVTKFGGNESYRKGIPLFLGLALGDVAMMLLWIIIDGWQGRTGHLLLPG